jgi:hypothetical protein
VLAEITKTQETKKILTVGRIEGRMTETSPYAGAQVALINEETWCVIGPNKRWSGAFEHLDMSKLDCPIVITTGIDAKNTLNRLLKSFVTIEGIHDLDLFLHEMEKIGGNVTYPSL